MGLDEIVDLPLLGHHEKTLNNQTFGDLRRNTLEKTERTFIFDDELHHLDKALEGLAVAGWWWLGLEPDLCYDQRLGRDCCHGFGNRSED